MKINEAIVHRIDKQRQENGVVTLRKDLLPNDKILVNLVDRTRSAYNDNPSRAFGIFQANQVVYPFSRLLGDYSGNIIDLKNFSSTAMDLLEKEMNKELLSTGGYVVFVSYTEGASDFFMVVLLKLKGAVGIDENSLALNENWNLDVDHLHEAARVNVTNWKNSVGSYISFARKGSGNKKFTTYFREFIGCSDFIESKDQTGKLVSAIHSYCTEEKLSPDAAKNLKAKAFNYFEEQNREKKPISLAAISMIFDNDNPKSFTEFIEKQGIEISDGFEPDKSTYRHLKRIGGKDLDFSINFDRSLLGNRVKYNKATKELIISQLPPGLVAELDAEN